MAELEIHKEHEGGEKDPMGQKIGIVTSLLAVCLAVVTIASHRAHTAGVLTKADENDQWALYQAERIKLHNLELGVDFAAMVRATDEAASKAVDRYKRDIEHYERESDKVRAGARAMEEKVKTLEKRALQYDLGEGLIEVGLVLCSLYFIAKKLYFPLIGIIAGALGIGVALVGLLE
jgi:hypothetical protein